MNPKPIHAWAQVSARTETSHKAPLTVEENADRAEGFAQFWTEKNFTLLDAIAIGDSIPRIVAASKTGNKTH